MRISDWSSDVCSSDLVQVLIEQQRLVVEGAGAAGIAALMHEPGRYAGRRVATVICGGNIDSRILASVMMRGLVRDGRIVRLRVEIPDEPGVLATVARVIGETGGNIVRSEEHTSELQSLMRISYAVFCLKKQIKIQKR